MPRYGHIADVFLTNIYNRLDAVGHQPKGSPQRRYATNSGELQAAPGAGKKLLVHGFLIVNEADEITRLRYNDAAGTVFAACPAKGAVAMNLIHINEAGAENQNIYMQKTGAGNSLAVVWTETVNV